MATWTNISFPPKMIERIEALVPKRAHNAPDYVRFWVKVGLMVDELRDRDGNLDNLVQALQELLDRQP